MGQQLMLIDAGPESTAERTPLAPLPTKKYCAPRLAPKPLALWEILFRPKTVPELVAASTDVPLSVAQNAAAILDLFRCMTADREEAMGSEAWFAWSWEELVCHIGLDHTIKYARIEARATAGGMLEAYVDRWLASREAP